MDFSNVYATQTRIQYLDCCDRGLRISLPYTFSFCIEMGSPSFCHQVLLENFEIPRTWVSCCQFEFYNGILAAPIFVLKDFLGRNPCKNCDCFNYYFFACAEICLHHQNPWYFYLSWLAIYISQYYKST